MYLATPSSHEPTLIHFKSVVSKIPDASSTEEHVLHSNPDTNMVTMYHKGTKIPINPQSTHIVCGGVLIPIQKEENPILSSSRSDESSIFASKFPELDQYTAFYIPGQWQTNSVPSFETHPFQFLFKATTNLSAVVSMKAYLLLDLTAKVYNGAQWNMNITTYQSNPWSIQKLQFYSGNYIQADFQTWLGDAGLYSSTPDVLQQKTFIEGDLIMGKTMQILTWDTVREPETIGSDTFFNTTTVAEWGIGMPYIPDISTYHTTGVAAQGALRSAMLIPLDVYKPDNLGLVLM